MEWFRTDMAYCLAFLILYSVDTIENLPVYAENVQNKYYMGSIAEKLA